MVFAAFLGLLSACAGLALAVLLAAERGFLVVAAAFLPDRDEVFDRASVEPVRASIAIPRYCFVFECMFQPAD